MMRLPCKAVGAGALILAVLGTAALRAQEEAPAKKSSPAARVQYSAAATLQNEQQYKLAAAEWQKFVKNFADDPLVDKARYYLGYCLLRDGKLDEAAAALTELIEKHPQFAQLDSAYLYLGSIRFNQASRAGEKRAEALKTAATTFATLLQKFPKSQHAPEALYYHGECLYQLGDREGAVKQYAAVAENYADSPRLADALYALGTTQEELKQWEAANKTYTSFLSRFEAHPLRAEVGMRLAETLLQLGKADEAVKGFAAAAAVENFPLAGHARMRQAAALTQLKRYEEAAKLYEALASSDPKSDYAAEAAWQAGTCYYLVENHAKAREWLGKVVQAGGTNAPEASHWIARSLLQEGKAAEALAAVTAILPKAGESPWLPNLLMDQADALYEIPEKRSESTAIYLNLAAKYPQHPVAEQAGYLAALVLLETKKFDQAAAQAAKFLEAFPESKFRPDVLQVSAESALQQGQHAAAEKLFKQLIDQFADRPEAETWRLRWALTLSLQKKHEELTAGVPGLLAAVKNPEAQAELQFLLGLSWSELKKFDQAAAALQASLEAGPKWRQADETLLLLAYCQRQLDDLNAGISTLKKLLAGFPMSKVLDRAQFQLGEYLRAANQHAAAEEAFAAVVAKFADSDLVPRALQWLGWTQYAQGKHEAAAKTAAALLDKGSAELAASARYLRGLSLYHLKQYPQAAADLAEFLKSKPPQAEASAARHGLGMCLAEQEKYDEAVALFSELLKEDPKYAAADQILYEVAWAYQSQKKEDEAGAAYARLLKEFPDSPLAADALFFLGERQYAAEEYEQAAKAYQEAAAKATQANKARIAEDSLHKLGWALFRMNNFAAAQAAFEKQLAEHPEGARQQDAAFMRAECLFNQDKNAEAFEAYQKLGKLKNPAFAELAALHALQSANAVKKFDAGAQLAAAFVEAYPESQWLPEVRYELAWALHNSGQEDKAIPLYEQVTEETSRSVAARARFMIGEIHFAKQQYEDAIVNFVKVRVGYSYPQWQADAQFEEARCYELLKKLDQARRAYQDIIKKYPDSNKAKLAAERLKQLAG